MAHTPGPWKRYEGHALDFRRPIITDSIPDSDGNCIANCVCYVATTNESWDANARLIAAAPDLLESCKELVLFATQMGRDCSIYDRAESAISKAEGKRQCYRQR